MRLDPQPDGFPAHAYDAVYRLNTDRWQPRREDQTDGGGLGLLPGEVTVDGKVIRFWVLPNGKLDSRNRYAVLARENVGRGVEYSNSLESALEEKYADDAPTLTDLSSKTVDVRIVDDPDGGYRYVREERTS